MSTFSTSFQLQDFMENFQSRKLLLHNPINQLPVTSAPPPYTQEHNTFVGNVIMILLVLSCALICSLCLNSLIRFALRCTIFVASEFSGNPSTNTGVKQNVLKTFSVVNYSVEIKLPGLDTECVICLAEFAPGECIRLLPKCNHGFHAKCIDKWLKSHSSCPKCRDCLIKTCQKIVGCNEASSSVSSLPAQESMVSIMPLEPEGFIRVYKGAT